MAPEVLLTKPDASSSKLFILGQGVPWLEIVLSNPAWDSQRLVLLLVFQGACTWLNSQLYYWEGECLDPGQSLQEGLFILKQDIPGLSFALGNLAWVGQRLPLPAETQLPCFCWLPSRRVALLQILHSFQESLSRVTVGLYIWMIFWLHCQLCRYTVLWSQMRSCFDLPRKSLTLYAFLKQFSLTYEVRILLKALIDDFTTESSRRYQQVWPCWSNFLSTHTGLPSCWYSSNFKNAGSP